MIGGKRGKWGQVQEEKEEGDGCGKETGLNRNRQQWCSKRSMRMGDGASNWNGHTTTEGD
jgi:hypothetical protein